MRARYKPSTYIRTLAAIFRLNPVLHFMARVLPGGFGFRPFLHRLRGVYIEEDVWIGDDVYIEQEHPEVIEIREGAAIATRCTIIGFTKGPGRIVIDRYAAIGAGSTIVCAAGQTLTIGEGAVVSAGSVVSNSIPAFTLCGPPRVKVFGKVTVPYRTATTMDEFRRGVQPLRAKTRQPESA